MYNARGDRTGESPGGTALSLSYDQANRLVGAGNSISYAYDGDGLRAFKTVSGVTTPFVWSEAEELPELLQDGSTYYIYGPEGVPIEQISGSTPTYLHQDQQGSTRLLTDEEGDVVGRYDYDAWGKVTGHTGSAATDLQYDGQYRDAETGFQYLRARYYDPSIGQFLTRDPAVAITDIPYGYASDDPTNNGDPTGRNVTKKGLASNVVCTGVGAVPVVGTIAGFGCGIATGGTSAKNVRNVTVCTVVGIGGTAAGGPVGGAVAGFTCGIVQEQPCLADVLPVPSCIIGNDGGTQGSSDDGGTKQCTPGGYTAPNGNYIKPKDWWLHIFYFA
jgi:RHS repeat-associated protein